MDLAICWDSVIFFTSLPTPADASRPRRPRQGVGPGIESKRTTRATPGFQVCASRSPRSRGIAIPKTGPSARTFAAYGPPSYAADPGTRGAHLEDGVAFASVETASSYVPREPSNRHSPKLYLSRSCRNSYQGAGTLSFFSPRRRHPPTRPGRAGPVRVSDQASSRRGRRGLRLGSKFARLGLLEAEGSRSQKRVHPRVSSRPSGRHRARQTLARRWPRERTTWPSPRSRRQRPTSTEGRVVVVPPNYIPRVPVEKQLRPRVRMRPLGPPPYAGRPVAPSSRRGPYGRTTPPTRRSRRHRPTSTEGRVVVVPPNYISRVPVGTATKVLGLSHFFPLAADTRRRVPADPAPSGCRTRHRVEEDDEGYVWVPSLRV